MSGVLDEVLDVGAALASLRALLNDENVFVAAGIVRLDCGHVRPTNRRVSIGDPYSCLLCGDAAVVGLDLIEPTEFPHADALDDLPVVSR